MADVGGGVVKLDGEKFTRDEARMLYHASFYLTNEEQPLPSGHPPTPAMTAQLKLAAALGEEVPDAALQNVQQSIDSARERAAKMQQQRNVVTRRKLEERDERARADVRASASQSSASPKKD